MLKMAPLIWRQCTLNNGYFKALFLLLLVANLDLTGFGIIY
tara:strand:+ start:481 stop:603 length:123 start_codon:yes stop_codon:yes gene_type:complete